MGLPRFINARVALSIAFVAALLAPAVAAGALPAAPVAGDAASLRRIAALPDGEAAEAVLVLDGPLTEDEASALRAAGLADLERFDFISAVGATGAPDALARALAVPGVEGVYPAEPLQWHLAESRALVRADDALRGLGLTGRNVTVAVVDSGIDGSHPGFEGRVLAGVKFTRDGARASTTDRDGHGTHIAGIVAGDGAKSEGRRLRGVAPGAGLVGLDISESFTTSNAIRAFQWVHEHRDEHDIRVVSNSWGRERDDAHYDPDDPVIRATNALVEEGVVVVFSAGNRGDERATLTVEAMNPNAITVGATDDRGRVESYSSRGPAVDGEGDALPWVKPDVVAPGTAIVSARTQHREPGDLSAFVSDGEARYYVSMNGTSMAAPHVAGVAALLLEKDPSLTPLAVKAILQETARDRGAQGPDPDYGYGLVDAASALTALAEAGPREVVVVSERHVPFSFEGEVVAAANRVVLHGAQASAPPAEAVEHAVEAPPGATSINLTLRWSAPSADFALYLVGEGREVGPFTADDDGVVRVDHPVSGAGEWVLRVEPRSAVAQAEYALEGHVSVLEKRVVERPGISANRKWAAPFLGEGGFFEEQARRDMVRRALTRPWTMPLGFLAAVAALGGAGAAAARRRWGWPRLPPWLTARR